MTSETVRKAAREVGQVTDFPDKYASTIELVKGDIDFGHSLNVKATPTLFINGKKLPRINDFTSTIDREALRLGLKPTPAPQGQSGPVQ